jgi:hypothetical protein
MATKLEMFRARYAPWHQTQPFIDGWWQWRDTYPRHHKLLCPYTGKKNADAWGMGVECARDWYRDHEGE